MIAFKTDSTVKNGMGGIIKPIVVCDYCHARIEGSGNVLWMPPLEGNEPLRESRRLFGMSHAAIADSVSC